MCEGSGIIEIALWRGKKLTTRHLLQRVEFVLQLAQVLLLFGEFLERGLVFQLRGIDRRVESV